MKLNIYSLFDSAVSAFSNPFFMQQDGMAIRAFQDNVNAKDTNHVSNHPDQFTLFKLGEFDDSTGKFILLDAPKSLALGVELIADDQPQYSNTDLTDVKTDIQTLIKAQTKLQSEVSSILNALGDDE